MWYDDNARPPLPPGVAGEAHGGNLILAAADGNRFAAYDARPSKTVHAQALIFPDVRGLHHFYKELALHFAEQVRTARQFAPDIRTPVLGLFGGADAGIPVEQVEALDRALDGTGIERDRDLSRRATQLLRPPRA